MFLEQRSRCETIQRFEDSLQRAYHKSREQVPMTVAAAPVPGGRGTSGKRKHLLGRLVIQLLSCMAESGRHLCALGGKYNLTTSIRILCYMPCLSTCQTFLPVIFFKFCLNCYWGREGDLSNLSWCLLFKNPNNNDVGYTTLDTMYLLVNMVGLIKN